MSSTGISLRTHPSVVPGDGGPVHSALHPPHSLFLGAALRLLLVNFVPTACPLPLPLDTVYKARIGHRTGKWELGLRFHPRSNGRPDQSHIKMRLFSPLWGLEAEKAAPGRRRIKQVPRGSGRGEIFMNAQPFWASALLCCSPPHTLPLPCKTCPHPARPALESPPQQGLSQNLKQGTPFLL